TMRFPDLLGGRGGEGPGEALKRVKEQLRGVPKRGLGYGVLKYLGESAEAREAVAGGGEVEVVFNYLGQLDQAVGESRLWRGAGEGSGQSQSARGERSHLLEIDAMIAGGQLWMNWGYSRGRHRRETGAEVAEGYVGRLGELIRHCQEAGAGAGYTPSDFRLSGLSQGQLDEVVKRGEAVEAIYRLSPMQEGLLFHTLLAPGSGEYVVQVILRLDGELDVEALQRAWAAVIARHQVLRASFHWQGLSQPVQVIHQAAEMLIQQQDWRQHGDQEQAQLLDEYLRADRRRGFDLGQAPLMRVRLVRTREQRYELIWSLHHLLMDGWSSPVLLKEVFRYYEAYRGGQEPRVEPSPAYEGYIGWLRRQDMAKAEGYWRGRLRGFRAPTRLRLERRQAE